MTEETKEVLTTTEAPVIAAEGDTKQKNVKKQFKRDETPVEELFDLTKPLVRVRASRTISRGIRLCSFLRNGQQSAAPMSMPTSICFCC